LRRNFLQFHSRGEETILLDALICLLTPFPSHGSLYFADDAFHGCTAAEITGGIDLDLKAYVESRFVVGPIAEKSFNDNGSRLDGVDCGPCTSSNVFPLPFQDNVANRSILA
jgi:hypothetical protein